MRAILALPLSWNCLLHSKIEYTIDHTLVYIIMITRRRSGNAPAVASTNNNVYTIKDEKDIKSHQDDDDDGDGVKKSTPSRVLAIIIRLVRPVLFGVLWVNIMHKSYRLWKVYNVYNLLVAEEGGDVNSAHLRSRVLGELAPQEMERFDLHPKNSDEQLKQRIEGRPSMVDMIQRVKEEVKLPFDVVYDEEMKEFKTVHQEEREYEVIVDRPKNSQKEYKVVVDKPKKKKTAGSSDIEDLTKIDKPPAKKKPQQSKPDVKAIEKKPQQSKPDVKAIEKKPQQSKPDVKAIEKKNKPIKKKESPLQKPKPMNVKIQEKGDKQKPASVNDKKKQKPSIAAAKDVKGKEKPAMKNDKDKGSFKKMKKKLRG